MTETTVSDRSVPPNPEPFRLRTASRRLLPWMGRALIITVIALGFYTLGRHSGAHEVEDYKGRNAELATEVRNLTTEANKKTQDITNLQVELRNVHSELDDILRPARSLEITANGSKPVTIGQMVIGLIGTPRNESVDLNINGKQQSATAGYVDNVQFTTNCRIEVTSFDVLKSSVVVNTACSPVKP